MNNQPPIPGGPCADVSAEPKIESFPQFPWDRTPRRSIVYKWRVTTLSDGAEVLVELSCRHGPKRYFATLHNVIQISEAERLHTLLDPHHTLVEPTDRYSKTRFKAFAQRALAELRHNAADPKIAEFLRGEHRAEHVVPPPPACA